MTIKYLKQIKHFFFLNLILSVSISILFFKTGTISGFENLMFVIILSGFLISFIIKENSLVYYIKLIFFNSLFFGFLLSLSYVISGLINDSLFGESFCVYHFYFFTPFFLFVVLFNFFGGIIGIVPKGIIERLKIVKNLKLKG